MSRKSREGDGQIQAWGLIEFQKNAGNASIFSTMKIAI